MSSGIQREENGGTRGDNGHRFLLLRIIGGGKKAGRNIINTLE